MYQDPMKRKAMPVRPPQTTVTPPTTQQMPTMAAPNPAAAPVRAPVKVPTTMANPTKPPPQFQSVNNSNQTAQMAAQLLNRGPSQFQSVNNSNQTAQMAAQLLNRGPYTPAAPPTGTGGYKPMQMPIGGKAQAIRQQQQDAIRERELARLRQIMGRG